MVTPDVGFLVPGRTLVIDPLANDRDPMGSVLAVQSLTQPSDSPLTATVHDLRLVHLSHHSTLRPPRLASAQRSARLRRRCVRFG